MSDDVIGRARALLEAQLDVGLELTVVERLRAHVWRVAVSSAPGVPTSVILRVGPKWVEGQVEPGIGWAAVFANEFAGSAYLGRLDRVRAAVPAVIAYDLDAQLLVSEDLGGWPSLATLLQSTGEVQAEEALVEHAGLLGRIAAASYERTDEYRELRERAGPTSPASLLDEFSSAELRRVLPRLVSELRIAAPTGLERELEALDQEADAPGRWLSYSPADACPDNNAVIDGTVRLFDFGFGGLRHVALDAAYSVIPFPTCWCYAPLPASVSERMLAAFRSEVAGVIPDAEDDALWEQKLAWACAMWFAGFVGAVAVREIDREQHRGPLTGRQAVVAQLESIAAATYRHHPAVSQLAHQLRDELRTRWGITQIPTYPAFRPASTA